MILCQCAGVTDKTVQALIGAGATKLQDITRQCGAGRCCAPCRDTIRAMLCHAQQSASMETCSATPAAAACPA